MRKREEKYLIFDDDGQAKIITKAQMYERQIDAAQKCVDELLDAAEFEARVAAMVSDRAADGIFSECEFCLHNNECMDGSKFPCRWYIMKEARLKVEEEMEG